MAYREADRMCERLAMANHGIVHRREALEAGLSMDAIRARVKSGRWIEIYPGAYLIAPARLTYMSRATAAVKWAGGESLASHRTAARVLGLDGIRSDVVEISTPKGIRASSVVCHRLRPDDRPTRRVIDAVPVTSVERTLWDVAAVSPARSVGRVLDDALRKHVTTLDRLLDPVDVPLTNGRPGSKTFKKLLRLRDERDGSVRSELETKMLRILKRVPGERVVTDLRVPTPRGSFYLDFAFPQHMVGVETHSLRWHFGEEKWKEDLRRDRALTLCGWTILYFSRDDVLWVPEEVFSETCALLDHSAAERGTRLPSI